MLQAAAIGGFRERWREAGRVELSPEARIGSWAMPKAVIGLRRWRAGIAPAREWD
jgi:hypothetical protein